MTHQSKATGLKRATINDKNLSGLQPGEIISSIWTQSKWYVMDSDHQYIYCYHLVGDKEYIPTPLSKFPINCIHSTFTKELS